MSWPLPEHPGPALRLLGGFEVRVDNRRYLLSSSAQRLVGLLGIHDIPLPRTFVAFTLWLEKTESRALANLRSMLWRFREELAGIVEVGATELALDSRFSVDVRQARGSALDVLEGRSPRVDRTYIGELLPGWYEEWVIAERERLRLLHLHALERQAETSLEEGQVGEAFTAAMAATTLDPLRESAQRLLIRAVISQGNYTDAVRIFDSYRNTLREQLGLDPSPQLADLVWSQGRVAL